MLRYQNKYRAVIKSRPDYVRTLVDRLNSQGVACDTPQVNHRIRSDLNASCQHMVSEAQRAGDVELARAFDVISKYFLARREENPADSLRRAANDLVSAIKDFLALPGEERSSELAAFCDALSAKIGVLEEALEEEA